VSPTIKGLIGNYKLNTSMQCSNNPIPTIIAWTATEPAFTATVWEPALTNQTLVPFSSETTLLQQYRQCAAEEHSIVQLGQGELQ
jgi:hypothetical protein